MSLFCLILGLLRLKVENTTMKKITLQFHLRIVEINQTFKEVKLGIRPYKYFYYTDSNRYHGDDDDDDDDDDNEEEEEEEDDNDDDDDDGDDDHYL